MKLISMLFFLLVCTVSFGQDIDELELVGTWNVENSETDFSNISGEQLRYVESVNTAFKNARFHFKANHHFAITIDFEDISNQMKNAYWKFNPSKSTVIIVDREDKDTNEPSWEWPIIISKADGKTFFAVTDGKFILEVRKN